MGFEENGVDLFYGSNWDPFVSLSQSGSFANSTMVPQNAFSNPNLLQNPSHLVHLPSDSVLPTIPSFGSGSLSEMVSSFGPSNFAQKSCQNSEVVKRKRKVSLQAPSKNHEEEHQKDPSETHGNKQKSEQNIGKQGKDNSVGGEASKENYIHVRAKRGQATNSHSLAERVRRERISERMRMLQELVPGCNKITGKAMMLDEIINYVQSLQQQVEFLSMKLATVNPELNVDLDRILSKDSLWPPGLSSSHPFPPYPQGTFNGTPGTTAPFHSLPQHIWNSDLQGILQMGFDPDASVTNLQPNDCPRWSCRTKN
ncbi:hypothetical protein CDL12_06058 [Handroanthus impetiginosus]|uniref:BHLH domain-containing protein n=1 Tax=Handroanthus impetiginosus TaxID=429701 RepID=A0A2G9HUQ1_9LAMI|nr:hypothetical protein CDL12_06058 [Handroanthus impetiginosus]